MNAEADLALASLQQCLARSRRAVRVLIVFVTLLLVGMAGTLGALYVSNQQANERYEHATEQRSELHDQLCELSRLVDSAAPVPKGC